MTCADHQGAAWNMAGEQRQRGTEGRRQGSRNLIGPVGRPGLEALPVHKYRALGLQLYYKNIYIYLKWQYKHFKLLFYPKLIWFRSKPWMVFSSSLQLTVRKYALLFRGLQVSFAGEKWIWRKVKSQSSDTPCVWGARSFPYPLLSEQ